MVHNPFFIVGCSRSGTTWLRNLLNSHPACFVGDESFFFIDVARPLIQAYAARQKSVGIRRYLSVDQWYGRVGTLFVEMLGAAAEKHKPTARVLGEKTPAHVHRWKDIMAVLPEARFLHVVRDPRDVVASMRAASVSWSPNARLSPAGAAKVWCTAVRSGLALEDRHSAAVVRVSYEDLHARGDLVLKQVFRFLKVSDDDELVATALESGRFERFTGGRRAGEPGGENKFYRLGVPQGWKTTLPASWADEVWSVTGELARTLGYGEKASCGDSEPNDVRT